jgi:EmrB/QacA subfamily drug resistance transporter
MGIVGLMVSVGLVSGPTLGGVILGAFTWHVIFFVNLPIGIMGTLMVLRFVPGQLQGGKQAFDWWGALLLFAALLCFLLAITLGPRASFTSPKILALGVLSAAGFVAFTRTELSTKDPLVDLGMFRNSTLATNVITGSLVFVASAGLVFLLPFFLQSVQGRSPRDAGLLLITGPVMIGLASPLSGWLSDRIGSRPLTVAGLVMLVFAYAMISTLTEHTSTVAYVGKVMWLGLGMGIFQSPNNSAIMGSVPRNRLGVASGLLSLTRTLGQTTGVALIGASWAALVHLHDATHASDAMAAPVAAQLRALQWVARAVAVMLCIALTLALTSWQRVRQQKSSPLA